MRTAFIFGVFLLDMAVATAISAYLIHLLVHRYMARRP